MSGYGLVLSGGGAKGSFEIGVWKALKEMNIPLVAVAGTSVGAINGAIIAQDEFDIAIDFWQNISVDQVIDINRNLAEKYIHEWSKADFEMFKNSFVKYILNGGFDITPLRKNLEKYIDEDRIRRSNINFGMVTVSLSDLKPMEIMIKDIPHGKLIDYLLASAAFPAFKKHEIDGKIFVDGGFYDNKPINLLASEGFENCIVVEFPAIGFSQKLKHSSMNLITVKNSEFLGLTLDFKPKNMKRNINMGYLDCLKAFNKVVGKNYYIDESGENKLYQKFKNDLGTSFDNENDEKLTYLIGVGDPINDSVIVNGLNRLKNLTSYKTQDLALSMLEITAKHLGIERLKKYSPDDLIKIIFITTNKIIEDNIDLIKTRNNVLDFFNPSKLKEFKPVDNIKFLIYYLYFISVKPKSLGPIEKLISRFTPEIALSIISLLYLTKQN